MLILRIAFSGVFMTFIGVFDNWTVKRNQLSMETAPMFSDSFTDGIGITTLTGVSILGLGGGFPVLYPEIIVGEICFSAGRPLQEHFAVSVQLLLHW